MKNVIVLALIIFAISSCKKTENSESNQPKDTSKSSGNVISDTATKKSDSNEQKSPVQKDTVKEMSFREFADVYMSKVKSSKRYFLDNSQGPILKDGYEFVSGYIKNSKPKKYGNSSVLLKYNEDNYEAELKFKKLKDGLWKAYMIDTFGE